MSKVKKTYKSSGASQSLQDDSALNTRVPATLFQRQFWTISQMHPHSSAYNITSVLRLRGPLDQKALEQSFNCLIAQHTILRTSFYAQKGELFQSIVNKASIKLTVIDSENLPDNENAIEVQLQDFIKEPFDLSCPPLMRTCLWRISDREHVLAIILHHSITDLRSKELIASEISHLYSTFIHNNQPALEPPDYDYSDYALFHQEWLAGSKHSDMLSYWTETLDGHSAFLNLPIDNPRPSFTSLNGTAHDVHLSAVLTKRLQQFSRQQNVTLFLTLLSAYYVLMHRYSKQVDIIVGVPMTNRRQQEIKDILGCFVNILPIAVDFSDNPSFSEILHRVRMTMLKAHRNQEAPYESILAAKSPKHSLSYNPLFQVAFTFEPPMQISLEALDVTPQVRHPGGSQLDMFLTLWEDHDSVRGFWEFNTDLFKSESILSLQKSYIALLESLPAAAEKPVSTMPVLSPAQLQTVVTTWNDTNVKVPEGCGIHHLFEKQVDRSPDAVAAVFEKSSITYNELNESSNKFAYYLRQHNTDTNDFYGIYMDRSLDMLIVIMGILKSDGTYIPLDPDFPAARISYMIEHAGMPLIITQQSLKSQLPKSTAQIICYDAEKNTITDCPANSISKTFNPEQLAYIIYTSGSTGKPKGVQISHRAAVNFLLSMAYKPGITDTDILLAVTTLSFDISVLEIFLPLISGACTVILNHDTTADPQRLLSKINEIQPTIMQATPTTWRMLLTAGWRGSPGLKILCGGEAFPPDLAKMLLDCSDSLWNMYGPTETTVWSTIFEIISESDLILIGRPIANTQIYILDQNLQPVPVGVSGEIYIGGAGLAHGYLHQSSITDERFILSPFHPNGATRIYKTGDYGRYKPDGNIEFFNRIDNQVKIHGFRIELGEIETIICTHPSVKEAVVTAVSEVSIDQRLIAYIVPEGGRKTCCRYFATIFNGFLA